MDLPNMENGNDHDLLIRLDTKMDRAAKDIADVHTHINHVRVEMQSFSTTVETKISEATKSKIDASEVHEMQVARAKLHDDHENRLRFLERYMWTAIGILALIQIALQLGLLEYIVQGIVRKELSAYEIPHE